MSGSDGPAEGGHPPGHVAPANPVPDRAIRGDAIRTVAWLVHPASPITRLLVVWQMGTGKTLGMIRVLDNFARVGSGPRSPPAASRILVPRSWCSPPRPPWTTSVRPAPRRWPDSNLELATKDNRYRSWLASTLGMIVQGPPPVDGPGGYPTEVPRREDFPSGNRAYEEALRGHQEECARFLQRMRETLEDPDNVHDPSKDANYNRFKRNGPPSRVPIENYRRLRGALRAFPYSLAGGRTIAREWAGAVRTRSGPRRHRVACSSADRTGPSAERTVRRATSCTFSSGVRPCDEPRIPTIASSCVTNGGP